MTSDDDQGDGRSALASDASSHFSGVNRSVPLFRQVAEQLIHAIENEHYPVGSHLPGEKELAQIFGVSRPSVREALSCLQFEGYLEPRRGSRTVVISTVDRASYNGHIRNTARYRDPLDVMEARLLLEPHVVGLAASDPNPQGLKALRRILEGMQLDLVDDTMRAHSDLVVHTTLVRVCKNRVLVEAVEQLLDSADDEMFRRARVRAWGDYEIPREWLGHHQTMVYAVMERDPVGAKDACIAHLLSVLTQIVAAGDLRESAKSRVEFLIKEHQ
ncbi:MAG: FadR/GntR family transcriptional regulator [Ferrimicrobium sp.]